MRCGSINAEYPIGDADICALASHDQSADVREDGIAIVSPPIVRWASRSPLPQLVAGVGGAALIVLLATLARGSAEATVVKTPLFAPDEVIATVAHDMRSTAAAAEVLERANASFDDGTWYINVGEAQLRFSQRNRIVVPTNAAAVQLQFLDGSRSNSLRRP